MLFPPVPKGDDASVQQPASSLAPISAAERCPHLGDLKGESRDREPHKTSAADARDGSEITELMRVVFFPTTFMLRVSFSPVPECRGLGAGNELSGPPSAPRPPL